MGIAAPIKVIGAENFYADLLGQVGGTRVDSSSLLNDPNADPHAFESSPADAAKVADAQLVIENGLGYDSFMDKLLAASPSSGRIVINVQQLLALPDGANAHIWYDPATMPRSPRPRPPRWPPSIPRMPRTSRREPRSTSLHSSR